MIFNSKIIAILISALCVFASANSFAEVNVKTFGAKGDGKTDDSAAIQAALDSASPAGDSVLMPAGHYLVSKSLTIPAGVSICGVNQTTQVPQNPPTGTVIKATYGAGHGKDLLDTTPALFEIRDGASVRNLMVWYPEQDPAKVQPYPWSFRVGGYATVENITLCNSYNGISGSGCSNIFRIAGTVLRRGIYVDKSLDVCRIDHVQFTPNIWSAMIDEKGASALFDYVNSYLEAFIFGRSDEQMVSNAFVCCTSIGFHFINNTTAENKDLRGSTYGHFTNIGADGARIGIQVDACYWSGLQITNGKFCSSSFGSTGPVDGAVNGKGGIGLLINNNSEDKFNNGPVHLVNCSFWGSGSLIVSHNPNLTSISDSWFMPMNEDSGTQPLVWADNGRIQLRGNFFYSKGNKEFTDVLLKPGVKYGIVTENCGDKGVKIVNRIGSKLMGSSRNNFSNEPPSSMNPDKAKKSDKH